MHLIWVGKTKNEHLRRLTDDYLQRLARFARCEVTEVRESDHSSQPQSVLDTEGKRIVNALTANALVVLLDLDGRQWSSPELAAEVERWQGSGVKDVAFVIGGHYGVSADIRQLANVRWSLSRLTLTHEMARVLTVEQLYRAYTILHGLPYQK